MKPLKQHSRIRSADMLKLSGQALGANRLRTALTVLGIAIGVFSVVGVMTALSAVRQSIDAGLSFLGPNVFSIRKDPAIQLTGSSRGHWRRPNITPDQAYTFADIMEENGLPTTVWASDTGERVRYGERVTSPRIEIIGTNQHYLLTQKYELAYGRNLVPGDIEFNRPVVVIGYEIEDEIFPNEDPLGKVVILDGSKYTVVGVLEERGDLFGKSLDNQALIPITRFVANNWGRWRSMGINLQAPSPESMLSAMDYATGEFRKLRKLSPGQENDFEVVSNESMQAAIANIAFMVSTGGLIISAIALICAGIGIMNIMLVSVTERTREIGLRKSIGARPFDILTQFLLEAIFLSLMGGIIGILLGIAAGNAVAHNFGVPMIIPWLWILIAICTCSAIGIGFGFFPAWRAARLHPIEALRYE